MPEVASLTTLSMNAGTDPAVRLAFARATLRLTPRAIFGRGELAVRIQRRSPPGTVMAQMLRAEQAVGMLTPTNDSIDGVLSVTHRLWPVGGAFGIYGVFFGAWGVSAPELTDALGGVGGFGLVVSAGLLLGAVGNAVGGVIAERRGTSAALAGALLLWSVLLFGASIAPAPWGLTFSMVLVFGLAGVVDVVANVAATAALSHHPGQLVRFHSTFNMGGLLGCLIAGVALGVIGPSGWRWLWPIVGSMAIALAVASRGVSLPAGTAGESVRLADGLRTLRRERLMGPALAFALGAIVEGGVGTWGVLHLRRQLGAGLLIGAGGALLGFAVAAVARVLIGGVATRRGAQLVLILGTSTTALGLAVLAAVPEPKIAALGLVAAAAGVAVCWPLILAEIGRGQARPGALVGAVTTLGYIGMVGGPAIIGALVARWNTTVGLWVLVVLAAGIAPCALIGRRNL